VSGADSFDTLPAAGTNLNQRAIASRIERVPLGRFHRRFITLISLGGWFDFYDIFMIAYIGAALENSGFVTIAGFSALVSAGFLGMFVGTIVFGMGSDRMGRRTAFLFMLVIYSVFTLAGAFAPSAGWLIVLRFFAGIGIGAEVIVIDTYVTEIVPSEVRGRYVAITQVVGFTAVPAAALLSRWLVPTHFLMSGWRWVMVIGALGALIAWYLRRRLPESPRWLESRGRLNEAEQIIGAIEAESGVRAEPHASPDAANVVSPEQASFVELWRAPYRSRTLLLVVFQALQTLGVYGFANWAPTYLLSQGFTLIKSLDYSMLIAVVSPLGPLLGALTADRLERKWTIVMLALLIAAAGLAFSVSARPAAIVLTGALVTIFSYWFSAAFHAYQSELYPTRARATGVGFTYSWSRLSAALSSLVIGRALVHGVPTVFALICAAMVGVAAVVARFGPRTNRQVLERLSA
jgi:MFS transporter, putative metabolite:H+ symporter